MVLLDLGHTTNFAGGGGVVCVCVHYRSEVFLKIATEGSIHGKSVLIFHNDMV